MTSIDHFHDFQDDTYLSNTCECTLGPTLRAAQRCCLYARKAKYNCLFLIFKK